jgi:hypothetical protein
MQRNIFNIPESDRLQNALYVGHLLSVVRTSFQSFCIGVEGGWGTAASFRVPTETEIVFFIDKE